MSITTPQGPAVQGSVTQEQFWKEHIAMQKVSGLSRTAYCRQHQLNYDRFYYWLKKEDRPARLLVPVKINQTIEASTFCVKAAPVLCTLTLKNGCILQVHDKQILPLILSASN